MTFREVADLEVDPATASVYEHGWQSWSPSGRWPVTATSPRPHKPLWQAMAFRPEQPAPDTGFQGEGLLTVQPAADAPVHVFATPDPTRTVPSVRAHLDGDRLHVTADGDVTHDTVDAPLPDVLATWAQDAADAAGVGRPAAIEPGWCSWYCYWNDVTEDDVVTELAAIDDLDLAVRTVQVDDGWQAGIGDWLTTSPRFDRMDVLARRIADTGRRAGIWTAPLLVGHSSELYAHHPEWVVEGALASDRHWDQPIGVLDVTNPDAADHLGTVFRTLAGWGYDYFKVDFLYAGAMVGGRHGDADPIAAYRHAITIIRDAIGPDRTLLGCGAPILPSLGLFDAMRISPDVDPTWEPPLGDVSQPSMRAALLVGRARGFLHDRWWVNDPDCLVVRGEVERRDDWVDHCEALGGLAVSSDHVHQLDDEALALTRRLLVPSRREPTTWDPDGDGEQGRLERLA